MKVKKKAWPEFFSRVKSGKKKYEFRVADFKIKKNDILVLEEFDPNKKSYTERKLNKKVGNITYFNPFKFNSAK
ncbi:MAG: DUF3850 domain-containing protein [Nanoarchaeota archaeon]